MCNEYVRYISILQLYMIFSILSFKGARFVFGKQQLLYLQGRNFQAGQEDPPLQQLRSHAQIFNG